MSLLIFAFSATEMPPAIKSTVRTVRVSASILRADSVSAESWAVRARRSERVFVERDGQRILLRTIDHE